jgi:hypothetical protein
VVLGKTIRVPKAAEGVALSDPQMFYVFSALVAFLQERPVPL